MKVGLFYPIDHPGGRKAYLPCPVGLGVAQIERRGKGIDQLRLIVGSAKASEMSTRSAARIWIAYLDIPRPVRAILPDQIASIAQLLIGSWYEVWVHVRSAPDSQCSH